MPIEIKTKIQVYEVDGEEVKELNFPEIWLDSHWNDGTRVVLTMPNSDKTFTILIKDLVEAAKKCEYSRW